MMDTQGCMMQTGRLMTPIYLMPVTLATLIITTICSDGVFIRSDKCNTIKHSKGPTEYRDDLNKVFVTDDRRIIIYNHGINRINRVSWREYATTLAAKLQQAPSTNLSAVLDLAAASLDQVVTAEVGRNKFDNFCAFVVIIKLADGRYHAGEVMLMKNQSVEKKPLGRFIRSGSGAKYVQPTVGQKNDRHWSKLTVNEAKVEVAELYDAAVKAQAAAQDHEFSPTCNDLTITP